MRLNSNRGLAGISMATIIVSLLVCTHQVQGEMKKSLYERLGGYDAVSAVVGEFAGRLFADEKLSSFFGGWSVEKQARFKQLNVLLVCNATGGPCTYVGRTMAASHQGMGVNDARFDQVAGHLVATLDKFKVPKAERDELLGIIGGLRPEIVGK